MTKESPMQSLRFPPVLVTSWQLVVICHRLDEFGICITPILPYRTRLTCRLRKRDGGQKNTDRNVGVFITDLPLIWTRRTLSPCQTICIGGILTLPSTNASEIPVADQSEWYLLALLNSNAFPVKFHQIFSAPITGLCKVGFIRMIFFVYPLTRLSMWGCLPHYRACPSPTLNCSNPTALQRMRAVKIIK